MIIAACNFKTEQLEQKFLEMFAIYFADRKATIDTLRYVQKTLTDTDFIDDDIEACEREMEILTEMIRQTVMLNASATVSEEEYRRRSGDLTDRFRAEEEKLRHAAVDKVTVYHNDRLVYSLKDGSEETVMM